jgi:hypothetical protein
LFDEHVRDVGFHRTVVWRFFVRFTCSVEFTVVDE